MLRRGRASVRCKATWLHPEQQECMGATISRHTFKCASFKKKKEQKGNAKVSATKWLLSRVRISLERLFWALAWSSPEVLCWAELESAELSSLLWCFRKRWAQVSGHEAMRPEGTLKPCFSCDDAQDLITGAELSLLRQSPSSAGLLIPQRWARCLPAHLI